MTTNLFIFTYICSYLNRRQNVLPDFNMYIWVARYVSDKKQGLLTLREHMGSPHGFCCVGVAHLFVMLRCIFLLFVFMMCLVCTMLPVSLDCPFFIDPSVSSNIYIQLHSKHMSLEPAGHNIVALHSRKL